MPQVTVQRIAEIIDAFAPFDTAEDYDNVGILAGDVALPRLGLSAADYSRLSDEVTDVLHCAATVNMLAGYDALKETNSLQQKSDAMNAALAAGEVDDISQVVIAGQKAEIALQLTMQVRNRALSAYQELMRMQV